MEWYMGHRSPTNCSSLISAQSGKFKFQEHKSQIISRTKRICFFVFTYVACLRELFQKIYGFAILLLYIRGSNRPKTDIFEQNFHLCSHSTIFHLPGKKANKSELAYLVESEKYYKQTIDAKNMMKMQGTVYI